MSNYIIDKSFQMVRTNTRLTSNIKINIDSEFNLYLESFNTNKQLSDDKYKHFSMTEQSYLEDKIPLFYDNLPINLAFDVKDNSDKDIVYNNFSNQFDDLYWSGVKKIEQNKFYSEEYEYFAPLYMKYKDLPDSFIILRVDNLGVYEQTIQDFQITNTTSDNFRKEIIEKWKCVSSYDMTTKSKLGHWLDNNFISNDRFPEESFEFDSESTNFSRWYGIDYFSGSFTEKSRFITDKIWFEQPHFRLEEYITDGFKDNGLVYPNILNMNFLFDDTPATPYKYNKYSLNRYFGFYVDLETIETLTSYNSEPLRVSHSGFAGLDIVNNIFVEIGSTTGSTSPFYETDKEWDEDRNYYIFVIDDLFEVVRIVDDFGDYSYNIISKYEVKIEDITKDKEMDIEFYEYNNFDYKNKIVMRNSFLHLDRIIMPSGTEVMPGDLYIIDIDGHKHVVEYDDNENEYLIRTDYGIRSDEKTLKYWIVDENESTELLTHDYVNHEKPLVFNIYKVKFRDVKDFDFNRVDTGFADFDFDKEDEYVETQEHKLYCVEHRDASDSTVFKEYPITDINFGKRVIASSEYVAGDELYEVTKDGLTGVWDKNQSITKWGATSSISHADYPYKINNSNKIGSAFNKTTNTLSTIPDISTKTNDFFYRIGTFISGDTSGYDYEYTRFKTQSLSIETDKYNEPQFNLDIYLDSKLDYFDYFFNNTRYVNEDDYIEAHQYSVFNSGSKYNLSSTLFKGVKYEVSRVVGVIKDKNGVIEKYLGSTKDFNQYKFSIIANYYQSGYTNSTYDAEKQNIIDNRIKSYPEQGVKTTKADLSKDGVHVFLNDKYKNILIIVNMKSIVQPNTLTLNNISYYDKEVVYNGKGKIVPAIDITTTLSTANIFMSKLNNNMINYYYIDGVGDSGHTMNTNTTGQTSTMQNIKSWGNEYSPFKIQTLDVNQMKIKKKSFKVAALKGPKTNIYDKFKVNFNEPNYDDSFIKEPLATIIEMNEKDIEPRAQVHGETLVYDKTIFRYNGSYEPIFKNISLFSPSNYYIVDGSEFNKEYCGKEYVTDESTIFNWIDSTYKCDDIYNYVSLSGETGVTSVMSDKLIITDFGFDLDLDTTIKGITVFMKRYADVGPDGTSGQTPDYYSGIADQEIILQYSGSSIGSDYSVKNLYTDGSDIFSSGITDSNLTNYWYNYDHIKEYGSNTDLWGNFMNAEMINDPSFGISIQVALYKDTGYLIYNRANIDCLSIQVSYTIDDIDPLKIYTTTISRNVRFDTDFKNFGEIDNLIYSKVNEKHNMLKLKNTKEDKSIYPKIDEFGYEYDSRFIFKSSWDSDYYIRTKKEIQ